MSEFTLQARRRTTFVVGVLFFMAAALVVRLLDLQLLRHDELLAKAQEVVVAELPIRAHRGHIYDRLGRPLALNEKGYVLWVDGEQFQATAEGVSLVSNVCLRQTREMVVQIVAGKATGFFLCSRWVEPAIAEDMQRLITAGDLQGAILEVEPKRVYPYGSLLAPVLGYLQDTGEPSASDTTAYEAHGGVEEFSDALLRGVDGKVIMERDPENFMIPIGNREETPPLDGANVTLTLDLNIQYMAEQRLAKAIEVAQARRGDIVVLDPRTGAILAMVSFPSFDPAHIAECAAKPECADVLYRNPPVGLHYEPGSTIKILTMAIALEEHVVSPEWSFECTGVADVNGVYFQNWDSGSHGHETLSEILLHSCNVGAVTVGQMIDSETYYRYLDNLGFGRTTGVDLAGEMPGYVRNPQMEGWTLVDQAANAFGQAIDVTPIQLASAVAAVANGGEVLKPYIVQSIEQDGVVTNTVPTLRSRVFHQDVCRTVTEMLVGVASNKGAGGGPLVPGYRLALKTGTASIPVPGEGYEPHRTIASAIGYGPADDPRFLILVRIEGNSVIWGEEVAVPVVGDLASFMLAYMHIPPTGE
jgi:cell division protein FtsI (penicillin-binding protein 3)